MTLAILSSILALAGIVIAPLLVKLYNSFPESWLLDYETDSSVISAKRLGLRYIFLLTPILAVCFGLFLPINPQIFNQQQWGQLLAFLFTTSLLALVFVADELNRVIPDQLLLMLFLPSLLAIWGDLQHGSLWLAPGTPWYFLLLSRFAGFIIGGGILLIIALVGQFFTGGEVMGFGDIKLGAVCGLLVTGFGIPFLLFSAFTLAALQAIPILIKRNLQTKGQLEKPEEDVHFSQDPNYIAFGPFLAMSTVLFLLLESPIQVYIARTLML